MFLATTALKDFWDLDDELLLLGPWCVRFDDPGWLKGLRHRRLPNVWDDRARLEQGALYCQEIQSDLLGQLADYLGEVHGVRLSPRYWQILIGCWLLYYCHQLFDRYTQVTEALKAYPDAVSLALHPDDFHTPRTTAEFLPLYHTDRYNLQLYSEIFRFLGKPFTAKRRPLSELSAATPRAASPVMRLAFAAATAAAQQAIARLGADIVTDELYPIGQRRLWRWTAAARGRSLPLLGQMTPSSIPGAVMDDRRLGLARLQGSDDFRKLLIATLPRALPSLALEGFAAARERSPARRGKRPGVVMGSTGFFYNDFFKLAASEWVERGAELWGLQHGGQYGTAKYSLAEWFERTISDRYFTWGWSSLEGDAKLRDLPMPPQNAGGARPRHRPPREDILVLTLENVKNAHHLFPHPMGWQWQDHFSWLERFLAAMEPRLASVRLRLYPHDYGWGHRHELRRRFPGLRFDSTAAPLMQRVQEARLVVTDYPGTPFFELLGSGVPSVHFWNERHWETRQAALPCFAALRDAGVLHAGPESAARKVLEVGENPGPWWDSEPVQAARSEAERRYRYTRRDWLSCWEDSLLGRRKHLL